MNPDFQPAQAQPADKPHAVPPSPQAEPGPPASAGAAAAGALSPEEAEAAAAAQAHEAQQAQAATADELNRLKAQCAELADQLLRARADLENTRRRNEDDLAKVRKFAVEAFAESLLPVADSLEAGLAVRDATVEQIREGAQATLRQLGAALERHKVVPIAPPVGSRFDPHQHQAISMVPAEQEANTVVGVLQKGYLIADRVLRPALVTVAAPKNGG